jgi:hypothetical protein
MRTLALWLVATAAYADIVYIKGGGKIEGVAKRDAGRVIVETERGVVTIDADQVLFIDTDHQCARELYHEKVETLKKSEDAKDFLDMAIWANENKLQDVYAYLFDKIAFLAKNEAELKRHLEAAQARGLGEHVYPLVMRAIDLSRDSKDATFMLVFAAAARTVKAPEAKKVLIDRAFELMTLTKDPREVLSAAANARELGFSEELAPFITRAAGLCAGKEVRYVEGLIEDLRDWGLSAYSPKFYRRILDLDPDNEKARRAMGYHRHQGRWLTEDEWQVAQGNVKYEYTWMSPAERDFRVKEKTLKLEERARELERERRRLDEARSRVDDERRRLEDERRALADRERRVADREAELGRHSHCDRCNVWYRGHHTCLSRYSFCSHCSTYYAGTHLCSHAYTYCDCCQGYFSSGHRCR